LSEYKFSKFVYFYIFPEAIALYHALKIKIMFLKTKNNVTSNQEFLDSLDKDIVNSLIKEKFVVTNITNENKDLEQIRKKEIGKVEILMMYLILSEQCNMSCRYCFFEAEMPTNTPQMDRETAKTAIDLFAKWVKKDQPASILLYGGDPFTNKKTMKFVIEYVQELINSNELDKKTTVDIVSNGVLIDKDIVAFLKKYKNMVKISISIDGPQGINDSWRVFHDQTGGFDKAIRGFRYLKKAGLKPGLSCTLPPTNLPLLEKITDWVLTEKPSGISYNVMTDIPGLKMDSQYADHVIDFMIKSFVKFREHGLYEDRVMRKVKSIIDEKRFLKDCCGYGQQIVITPNGDIGVCHGFTANRKYFVANINKLDGFDPHNHVAFMEWNKRSPINIPECYNCPCVGICGGGCALNAYNRHGSIWALDDIFCPQANKILHWMIEDIYKQTII
jgi:uncharacterized protein